MKKGKKAAKQVARLGLVKAAEALGKNRKVLQRWRKVAGAPFAADGSVDLEELRAWAEGAGLLRREVGRPPEFERLADEARAPLPVPEPLTGGWRAPGRASVPDAGADVEAAAVESGPPGEAALGELSAADRDALAALLGGDTAALMNFAARHPPELLKKFGAAARVRQAHADAERRELENAETRKELVRIERVKAHWTKQVEIVKGYFFALPGKISSALVAKDAVKDGDAVYKVIEDELHDLLEAFAVEVPA